MNEIEKALEAVDKIEADYILPDYQQKLSYSEVDALFKKIRAALEARLEISEEHGIDGIEARDATIKGQDKTIDALKSENERLREVLERSLIKHKAYVGICEGDKELVTAIIPMIEEALKGDA